MSRRERERGEERETAAGGGRKACCMISELLEESGIDREHVRRIRRQVLQGIVLLCQWQLERMDEAGARERESERGTGQKGGSGRKGRNISVE